MANMEKNDFTLISGNTYAASTPAGGRVFPNEKRYITYEFVPPLDREKQGGFRPEIAEEDKTCSI